MRLQFPTRSLVSAGLLAAAFAGMPAASADVIYQTNNPFGGFLGINGFDVFQSQSVATRFTPDQDYTIDGFAVWLWNNDESGGTPPMSFTLRLDDPANGESRPSNTILETWEFTLPNTGVFNPLEFSFTSATNAALTGGQRYWIVAESPAGPGVDPVWAWAANDSGVSTNTDSITGEWYPAPEQGAVATLTVTGTPAGGGTPGDIDGDGDVDIADLAQLLAAFGACTGDAAFNPAADFDASGCIELADLATLLANFGATP